MSIKYSLISKEKDKVLCEYTDFIGNFEQISRELLKKVKSDSRGTFLYDKTYNQYKQAFFSIF
jgi:hypothetical protein